MELVERNQRSNCISEILPGHKLICIYTKLSNHKSSFLTCIYDKAVLLIARMGLSHYINLFSSKMDFILTYRIDIE
jgi:hypothetical protein